MTSLVGASVLFIAASSIALVFGWITANESLIWTSIAASVGSGVALALAYGRARQELPSRTSSPDAAAAAHEDVAAAAPETAAPEAVSGEEVVGVPHTKRFHKTTCRYAHAKNATNMTKSDALARGFTACGICKP